MIFRHLTLQPAGLNANFNFLRTFQSQRAHVNVSFCFDFSLNDTLRVFFFSCFKPLRRREHPQNIWFCHALSMQFVINAVKIIKHLHFTAFSNFLYLNMQNLVKQAREKLQRTLNARTVL